MQCIDKEKSDLIPLLIPRTTQNERSLLHVHIHALHRSKLQVFVCGTNTSKSNTNSKFEYPIFFVKI